MDRAYEGNETRQLALDLGCIPVVPSLSTRIEPWEYDQAMYKRRNEVERLFRRLKGYRRIFSHFEKLDLMFLGFINFMLIADGLRGLCQHALHLRLKSCCSCSWSGRPSVTSHRPVPAATAPGNTKKPWRTRSAQWVAAINLPEYSPMWVPIPRRDYRGSGRKSRWSDLR